MDARPRPVVLIICDGWGVGPDGPGDVELEECGAVAMATTPVRERLVGSHPWNLLRCSGEDVGLPAGQMGNSEVGHLNLGAGRVVYQDVTRISRTIREGALEKIPALGELATAVRDAAGRLHLIGLCSDGGVHSHVDHLMALLDFAEAEELPVRVHCFTDGRDTSPTSGVTHVERIRERLSSIPDGALATVIGRYHAMDRDNRWERTERAYRALVDGSGEVHTDPVEAIREQYARDITDEFLPPIVIPDGMGAPTRLEAGDGVLFFNFRADRARQLTNALTAVGFEGFVRTPVPVHMATMTRYEDDSPLPVLFPPRSLSQVLGEVVAEAGMAQLRIAETEKYPHVTYFFNGGVEEPLPGEQRVLVPSPKVATYDLQPEMRALEVTEQLVTRIEADLFDFILVNYANADMVGHTGSIPAAIRAVEVVDHCVGLVLDAILAKGGCALVTADHGNAEKMLAVDGSPFTAHTTYPVQCIFVSGDAAGASMKEGILADVAPTLLGLLGVPIPEDMTGGSLLS